MIRCIGRLLQFRHLILEILEMLLLALSESTLGSTVLGLPFLCLVSRALLEEEIGKAYSRRL